MKKKKIDIWDLEAEFVVLAKITLLNFFSFKKIHFNPNFFVIFRFGPYLITFWIFLLYVSDQSLKFWIS